MLTFRTKFKGFEDVLLLDELLEQNGSNLAKVLPLFSALRCDNAHAIVDLAMYNYLEVIKFYTFINSILYFNFHRRCVTW